MARFHAACMAHAAWPPSPSTYTGQRGATAGVVDNLVDSALDVMVALSIVHHTELGSSLAVSVVGLENRPTTLTLRPNNATHLQARVGNDQGSVRYSSKTCSLMLQNIYRLN